MTDFEIKLKSLDRAIGIRKNLQMKDLKQIMKEQAAPNDRLLKDYFDGNPVVARFIEIIDSKQFLPSVEYENSLDEFYQKYPQYRQPAFQKKVFNQIRKALPSGSLVSVKGGFAVLKTEARHGRSPNGTFPVKTEEIRDVEDFKHTRGSISETEFLQVFEMMTEFLSSRVCYETSRFVGQGELAIPVRLITDRPMKAAFSMNMFREDAGTDGETQEPWTILYSPSFRHPREERFIDGVFKFTNYKRRIIIIGGTGYNGEIKKGMFAVANHIYPLKGHLSLHCSSVYNDDSKDVTLIFGLSGTGKSTVSSGVEGGHMLSDDETALNLDTKETFNLENGNYYKTGGLLSEKKVLNALENMPDDDIALYENIVVSPSGHVVFAADPTNNGRVSIPLTSLEGAIQGGKYPMPKRIIILSRDVNGILDPVNILNKEQIIYYLNLGYTSKTPGTEAGVNRPIPTYSKWEGGPFYDLKDEFIMKAFRKFLDNNPVDGIFLNSGEGGGPYGSSFNKRFPVSFTLELAKSFVTGALMEHYKNSPDDFEANDRLASVRPKQIPGLSKEINNSFNAEKLWQENGMGKEYEVAATELFNEFKIHAAESLQNGSMEANDILNAGPV
ncbi:MAG: phosphoenolpyruvate carboxykinase (ATP) [Leptospirales bacterium]